MKRKNQPDNKKIIFLFFIVLLVVIDIILLYNINLLSTKKVQQPTTSVDIVLEAKADWTTVPCINKKDPAKLNVDLSEYPLSDETSILFMIYNMFDVPYDIDTFYQNYFNLDYIGTNSTEGKASPELLWGISNIYFESINKNIKCNNIYQLDKDSFYKIVNNQYPIMIWYDSVYNGVPDYAWQYTQAFILYKSSIDHFYLMDTNGSEILIEKEIFYDQWLKCGGFALVFGNYS